MTVYVECDPDTVLAETLTGRPVSHQHGKSRVCHILERRRNCIGIVDEDPSSTQPPLIAALGKRGTVQIPAQLGLKMLQDNPNNNVLVLLRPRLEEWVLAAAKDAGISMERYSLPSNPKELHKRLTLNRKHQMDSFRHLLQDLGNTPRIRMLKRLLEDGV